MLCDRCGKDYDSWSELHSVPRIDNTPNCHGILKPTKPRKEWVCYNCLSLTGEGKKKIYMVFRGIDSWNRPVFFGIETKKFYGSTDKMFDYDTPKEMVLEKVKGTDLVWFGLTFDCEPEGNRCPEDEEWEIID